MVHSTPKYDPKAKRILFEFYNDIPPSKKPCCVIQPAKSSVGVKEEVKGLDFSKSQLK